MKNARVISLPVQIMRIKRLCDNVMAVVGKRFENQREREFTSVHPPSTLLCMGCSNKSARFNFVIKRTIYSKSADIFISV